ncbi:X15341 cytochrome C oxidase subunit [Stereum hirsutum FP-91666 SS1]|uniref:X15341 cytochrome C oxidase subunit n=1 Tax=Stereum hirsutum (strain FP-91666) TaxID=721885 RepID=UPI000440F583|nr:X15341 cytochrome C oxidase subunit [Stereum hirsutum FP-91666 SS1]EIM92611.1 X15341 cytochrome C oxidase subunit [Stereum hirsutum FP-91666 SS1]
MSLIARNARSAARVVPRNARSYALTVEAPAKEWAAKREAIKEHANGTTDLWRKISYFVAVPAIVACTLWVRNTENDHSEHMDHLRAENDGHLPQPPDYPYLNRRNKPFPWGPNSLFFNPHVNKDMGAE